MSLCLDIDAVRGLLGGWKKWPSEAGLLARRVGLAMARVTLEEGRDVVVPQFLARPGFVESLEALADELGARFVEVVLLDSPDTAAARLAERAAGPMTATQRDAHELLDRDGGPGTVPDLHRRLLEVVNGRPATVIVTPVIGDVEQTYRTMIERICSDGPSGGAGG